MSKKSLSYEPLPDPQDIQCLTMGISAHAQLKKNLNCPEPFAFFIRDEKLQILAGCNGVIFYGCLYVDQLWVDESLRGQGYGTQLMDAAETLAKQKNCSFMAVNTMDWEALGFYKKLDYHVEFERTGFQKNSVFYFLRKDF